MLVENANFLLVDLLKGIVLHTTKQLCNHRRQQQCGTRVGISLDATGSVQEAVYYLFSCSLIRVWDDMQSLQYPRVLYDCAENGQFEL